MGHEKDIRRMETVADREAGLVVFEDLKRDPDTEILCCPGCGSRKGDFHHRRLSDSPGWWCPHDRRRRIRPSWDHFFMSIARMTATRATCDRKHVGAVLVLDRRIVAGGYNGSISGLDHCDDIGHDVLEGHCVRTVHAEANAVADAARRGIALEGATAYVTALPCWLCFKLLVQAGIGTVVYGEAFRIDDEIAKRTFAAAEELGIPITKFEEGV